jgi:hypothetical protein
LFANKEFLGRKEFLVTQIAPPMVEQE